MLKFQSFLAEPIRRFIDLRRLSGTDYHSQAVLLGAFDRFVAEQTLADPPRVTRALIEAYQSSLSALAARSRSNRLCVVRQLCRYLAARDPRIYVPEPLHNIPARGVHLPYIYSTADLSDFRKNHPYFWTLCPLERGFTHFNDESFSHWDLRPERRELSAKLLLSGTAFGLLQGFQANGDRLSVVAYPAVAVGDRIEQVHHFVIAHRVGSQPIDHLFAGIPHPGGDEVEQVFAFVVHLFERAVVL